MHLMSGLSLESGLTYFGAKGVIGYGKLFTISIFWAFIAGAVLFLFTRLHEPGYFFMDEKIFDKGILFFVVGNMLSSYGTALFFSQKNFIIPNVINLCVTVILIFIFPYGGRSILPGITDDNYFYFYFLGFLSQGILTLLAFVLQSKTHIRIELLQRREFYQLMKFSATAWLGNIIFFLLYRIDYWFVAKFCTATELGNYIQVSKLAQLFFFVPAMFASVIFPLTAAGDNRAIFNLLSLFSRGFLFVYSIVCLLLILSGYWLFPFVFGESFSGMYIAFLLYVPGILSLGTLYSLTAYNSGNDKISLNLKGSLYALIFVTIANFFVVPKFGIPGAAAVCSAGYILYQVYLLRQLKISELVNLHSFFFIRMSDFAKIKTLLKSS